MARTGTVGLALMSLALLAGAAVPGTGALLNGVTANSAGTWTTTSLYSPTNLTASKSGGSISLSWMAAQPNNNGNGNGYAISGVNNGASSSCPNTAASYTTFVGSTAGVTFTDSSSSLLSGASGTYVCYLVQTGYRPAGGPPWNGLPVWTSSNSLPVADIRLGTPALVQKNSSFSSPRGATTLSVTWPAATMAGNLLVALVGSCSSSVTPSMPAGWQPAVAATNGTSAARIFYYPAAPSFAAGSSVTVDNGGTKVCTSIVISEWSGGVSALDVTGTATGTAGSTTVSTTAPTAQGNELGVAGVFAYSALPQFFVQDVAWSEVANTGAGKSTAEDLEYKVLSGAGVATATDSWITNDPYAAVIATFK